MFTRQNLPTVKIEDGTLFTVEFPNGKTLVLTWEEWMALRMVQNSLIYTEPL